jgi:hypothetical protein
MASHIRLLGILHIILSSLGVSAAVIVLFLFGGLASILGMPNHVGDSPVAFLATAGGIIFVVLMVISLPGLVGGIGLLKFAPWSRILMLVLSVIDLVHIPFGLALGIYGLWVLTKPETAALMSRNRYQPVAY